MCYICGKNKDMAYQKLQALNAAPVILSDTVNIPLPGRVVLTPSATPFGALSGASFNGTTNTVTFTTTSAHGLSTGDFVYVVFGAGIIPIGMNAACLALSGVYPATVVNATQFSVVPVAGTGVNSGTPDASYVYLAKVQPGQNYGCTLYVGGAGGNVRVLTAGGDDVTFPDVFPGFMPVQVVRVFLNGTSASVPMIALW